MMVGVLYSGIYNIFAFIATVDLVTRLLSLQILERILPVISRGFIKRDDDDSTQLLNIIACENTEC